MIALSITEGSDSERGDVFAGAADRKAPEVSGLSWLDRVLFPKYLARNKIGDRSRDCRE